MPHISRKELEKEIARQVYKQFVKMLADDKASRIDDALGDLLTETEHMMLAKRFAAIIMLAEGVSPYRVRVILKISPTTAMYLKERLEEGEYKRIERIARQKREREQFWEDMEKLLRLGMPEMGSGRWKWLDELYPRE